MSLKDQVEELLPSWRRWYPSLFDAATDLGLIRARVCSPDSLLLSNRHKTVQSSAEAAHRKQWGAEEVPRGKLKKRKR
ncbi:MAG: hypothetical protein R3305_04960 [Gammaproteobacteria bacterium]|nr:hypothetical protein [Gammaproteobacteria bacterium]